MTTFLLIVIIGLMITPAFTIGLLMIGGILFVAWFVVMLIIAKPAIGLFLLGVAGFVATMVILIFIADRVRGYKATRADKV